MTFKRTTPRPGAEDEFITMAGHTLVLNDGVWTLFGSNGHQLADTSNRPGLIVPQAIQWANTEIDAAK